MSDDGHVWWEEAVVYEVYPRSFADADGDGVGDLPGLRSRLPYLADLGVDAIWLTPFYPSPLADGGYDVSDYRAVDPLLGTMADFDALVSDAAGHQIRVIIDLVPNHCSSTHPLFQAALAAPPGSRERARFIFRDGRGEGGEQPPNNWISQFAGPAWTRVTEADGRPGQWYLHLFDHRPAGLELEQPGRGLHVRGRDQVLAGPRRRRAAGRRRARPVQGPKPARHPGRGRAERALPVPPPARTPRALPVLAGHPGLLSGHRVPWGADGRRRGLVRRAADPGPVRSSPAACPRSSTSSWSWRGGRPPRSAPRSTTCSR